MNLWELFAALSCIGLLACGIACARGDVGERVIALQLGQVIALTQLLMIAEAQPSPDYFDVPLTLVVVAFAGSLAFCRFLERWL